MDKYKRKMWGIRLLVASAVGIPLAFWVNVLHTFSEQTNTAIGVTLVVILISGGVMAD